MSPSERQRHLGSEVVEAARAAFERAQARPLGPSPLEAALQAAEKKRCELAQADPEGQEYVYRLVGSGVTWPITEEEAKRLAGPNVPRGRVERALLGTWEKLD